MSKPMTHKAKAKIILKRGSEDREVLLRETKTFWVSEAGKKYRKTDGTCPADEHKWALYLVVDTDSIEPIAA